MPFELSRSLTPGEIALARSIFGDAIDYSKVRLVKRKWWPFQPRSVAMAPMGHIHFHPHSDLWSEDFAREPLHRQGLFIHELTHVWQATNGVNLLTGKLRAGDRPETYRYPLGADCAWDVPSQLSISWLASTQSTICCVSTVALKAATWTLSSISTQAVKEVARVPVWVKLTPATANIVEEAEAKDRDPKVNFFSRDDASYRRVERLRARRLAGR